MIRIKKEDVKRIAAIILAVVIIFIIAASINGCHGATRAFGGEMSVELAPGQKLEEITWKEESLWILTRPMREGETAEIHTFYEDSEWGVLEGAVTIIEKEG
jgi:hypothetical protein